MTNLSVKFDRNEGTSAMITWTPPYTLMNVPILSYVVNVGTMLSITNTSLVYIRPNFGMFNVAVRPVNKVGKGKIAATFIHVDLSVTRSTIATITALPQISPGNFERT